MTAGRSKQRLGFITLSDELGTGLPLDRVRTIRELIDVGEAAVALEILAENLHDADVGVSAELLAELRALAAQLSAQGPFDQLKSPQV